MGVRTLQNLYLLSRERSKCGARWERKLIQALIARFWQRELEVENPSRQKKVTFCSRKLFLYLSKVFFCYIFYSYKNFSIKISSWGCLASSFIKFAKKCLFCWKFVNPYLIKSLLEILKIIVEVVGYNYSVVIFWQFSASIKCIKSFEKLFFKILSQFNRLNL